MKISLIGAGIIGHAHGKRLNQLDDVDQLLVADAYSQAKADELAGQLEKAKSVSVDAAFEEADAVVITANTAAHAELIKRGIKQEKPTYCEKPVALDVDATKDVVSAWKDANIPVQIGFQRRFDAGYNRAKQAYQSGELGFVHTLHATTLDQLPPPATYIPTSGGLFKDCSIHDFDIIRWLTGLEASTVWAQGSNMGADFFTSGGDVDSAQAMVTYENGMVAQVAATRYNGAGHDVRLELFGEKDGLFVGLDDRSPLNSAENPASLHWNRKEPYHAYNERFDAAYFAELKYFLRVAKGEVPSPCTPEDALASLYIAEAAIKSMKTGEPVTVQTI